jgi:hypothetical protein
VSGFHQSGNSALHRSLESSRLSLFTIEYNSQLCSSRGHSAAISFRHPALSAWVAAVDSAVGAPVLAEIGPPEQCSAHHLSSGSPEQRSAHHLSSNRPLDRVNFIAKPSIILLPASPSRIPLLFMLHMAL